MSVIKHFLSSPNPIFYTLFCDGGPGNPLIFTSCLPLTRYSSRRCWRKIRNQVEREWNILFSIDLFCLLILTAKTVRISSALHFQSQPPEGISCSQAAPPPCEADLKYSSVLPHVAGIVAARWQITEVWDPAPRWPSSD